MQLGAFLLPNKTLTANTVPYFTSKSREPVVSVVLGVGVFVLVSLLHRFQPGCRRWLAGSLACAAPSALDKSEVRSRAAAAAAVAKYSLESMHIRSK